jgi:hypothetical protein
MTEKSKGIVLIALGNPYYGQLAANLAASIKWTSPTTLIHLVHDANAISTLGQKVKLFNTLQVCPVEFCHRGERFVPIKAKVHLYDLSPFDETIFLDVDTILCSGKNIADLFNVFAAIDFTMENRARINLEKVLATDTYLWANVQELKQAYKLEKGYLMGLHSEFIYFKKNARMAKFFKTVKEVFEKPKCKIVAFNGDLPDEFAFAIAMVKHEVYPHESPFIPLYWYLTDKHKGTALSYVIKNYYGYSVGGNATPLQVRNNYDQLARAYFQRLQITAPFRLLQKRQVLTARAKM